MKKNNIRSALSERIRITYDNTDWETLSPSERERVISSLLSDLTTRQFCEVMYCDDSELCAEKIINHIENESMIQNRIDNIDTLQEQSFSYPVFSFTGEKRFIPQKECEQIQYERKQHRVETIYTRLLERFPDDIITELTTDDVVHIATQIESYIDTWRWEELQNHFRDEVGAVLLKHAHTSKNQYVNRRTVDVCIDECGPYRIASWVEEVTTSVDRKTITRGDWIKQQAESISTPARENAGEFRIQCYSDNSISKDVIRTGLESFTGDDVIIADTYADGIAWLLCNRESEIPWFNSVFADWLQSVSVDDVFTVALNRVCIHLSSFVGNDIEKAVTLTPMVGAYAEHVENGDVLCSLLDVMYVSAKHDITIVWPYVHTVRRIHQSTMNDNARTMAECILSLTE